MSDLSQFISGLKQWVKNRQSRSGLVVTADELMERALRRRPNLTEDEKQLIYEQVGAI